ncbi:MAG TPA: restriction endonuclease subunit S, partial [Pyrinomonadaceae bacterium]|nr:restriction endonuclease subunit S [Pyrinomonadaceae bacterium]
MKTYEKYKPSGIEWIGDIPEHWNYHRIKAVFESEQNGIWGDESQENENDVYCLRVADFDRDFDNLSKQNNTLRNISNQDFEKRKLEFGDLLLEKSGGGEKTPVGRVGVYDWHNENAVCSNFMARLKVNSDKAKSKFLFYFFKKLYAVRINTKSIKQTTGIQNLDSYNYFNEIICLPTLPEQTAIADYLDEKTAEIDKLIANKKRLIELLKEERTAIINKAVTRGINADAKLKPSGIDWLGDIPEHWEVKKLKWLTNLIQTGPFGSQLHAQDYVTGGIPVINPAHISESKIFPDENCAVALETWKRLERHAFELNDIVIARRGEMGRCALINENEVGWLCGTGSLLIRLNLAIADARFLTILLSNDGVKSYLSLVSVGSTMDNLNTTILGELPLS